jgi:rod shape-determining protein MreC
VDDKTIRRRRAVLALLVVVSLILLTDYFGSPSSSPLHAVQRGIAEVLSPIQDGASKVLSPVRDVGNYFSSTLTAKSRVARLLAEDKQLTKDVSRDQYDAIEYRQDQKLLGLNATDNLSSYGLKAANVIARNPVVWYETITIDKGSDAGVKVTDPVIGPGGLVGDVSIVGLTYSVVTLITSPDFAVGAMVENTAGDSGVLQPAVGNPGALELSGLPTTAQVQTGQEVVTSGFQDTNDPAIKSYYPAAIPIGQISSQNPDSLVYTNQAVQVNPAVDLTHLSVVRVLTKPFAKS